MSMFLDAFFLQIFEHFSSTPIPPTSPPPPSRRWSMGGGGGSGMFLDSFLEFLEGV